MANLKGPKASTIECDIAVIGSGMGGSSVAHRLRDSGLRVVVVERGDRVPREEANWNADEVFGARRYHNAESWIDGHTDKNFSPGVFYYVGGNTKFSARCCPAPRAGFWRDQPFRRRLSSRGPSRILSSSRGIRRRNRCFGCMAPAERRSDRAAEVPTVSLPSVAS